MSTMRISQLAERTGVPATTLRFYETSGLLPADRTDAGYRIYGEDAVRRLGLIDAAKHLGLPLEEIAELLAVWESGACAQVKADLQPRIAHRLAETEQRAAELAAFSATLRGALAHLEALPDRDEPCGPQCGFLASAATPSPGHGSTSVPVPLFTDRHAANAEVERWRQAPVACTLSGADLRERADQWREALTGATRTAIPDGLRLTVSSERAAAIAALAAAEQQCCAFFDFRLHLDGPNLHLEVRAPEAGAGLLAEVFAPRSL
ncbi:MerR family copper efflux transcriptional regulator [Catenulispora sp. GAS73]|uniref:MerR family transcriptional regulator n=1 Tax=Catenulispora sp. GAS73 TaxID=3156269 RepID=UPI003518376F